MTPDELIAPYLEEDPNRPGLGNMRVKERSIHVWALIGHLRGINWNLAETAEDYELPTEIVEAALAFYKTHKDAIDGRLAQNEPPAA